MGPMELERKFWEAAGDRRFYEQHFATKGVMAFPVGLMDKAQVVEAIDGAPPWESYTVDDLREVHLSDDVVALAYTTHAVSAGSPQPYRAAVISVYVRRGGAWELATHQQTPLQAV